MSRYFLSDIQYTQLTIQQWRTVQEANEFYKNAKNNQEHVNRPGHITLAGTLDEYGDIRSSRPHHGLPSNNTHQRERGMRTTASPPLNGQTESSSQTQLPLSGQFMIDSHELEADMLQWPFIDETWSSGFDTGFDTAWPHLV